MGRNVDAVASRKRVAKARVRAVSLGSVRKAAVLLVAAGKEGAAEVIRHLREEEVQALTHAVASLGQVTGGQRLSTLVEALQRMARREYVTTGGVEFAREVLERALGPDRAQEVLERIASSVRVAPMVEVRNSDPAQLASVIRDEHPQTIALILAHLRPQQAASVLSMLPHGVQGEVAMRIALMDRFPPEVLRDIEASLSRVMTVLPELELQAAGGIKALAEVLSNADRGTERHVLEGLEKVNPELAQEVRRFLFVFEDIMKLDDRSIQTVLRSVDSKDLALAMKGASPELRQKIFSNMSQRAAEMLKEDMEFMGPVRRRDVEEAQQRVVEVVRKLEEAGSIVISRGEQEEFIA